MAKIYDRVREASNTSGAGTMTLGGAATGFRAFSAAFTDADTLLYCIEGVTIPSEWEVGVGTYSAGTLARNTILASSNGGSAVNFSAGTKNVFCTMAAGGLTGKYVDAAFSDITIGKVGGAIFNIYDDVTLVGSIYADASANQRLILGSYGASSHVRFDAPWGTERMRIDAATGRVGIGTTSPGELLSLGLAGTLRGILSLAGSVSGKITIQPATAAGTWTLQLPTGGGTSGYVLQTDGTGVTSWVAALVADANNNISANNFLSGYATTATAAGTTTLTAASAQQQFFTGTTTQTVTLPVTSTLALGFPFLVVNNSTGAVTVNSSGGNAVLVLAGGTQALLTCVLTSGTTAASWNATYAGTAVTSAKKLSVSNSLTLVGTDGTSMTFPTTSATLARTDAGNTFTGHQTIEGVTSTGATGSGKLVFDTSPALATPTLGVASATSINKWGFTAPTTAATLVAGADNLTYTFPSVTSTLASLAGTETFTNKRITPRRGSTTSSATPTINTDSYDIYSLTAQTADITSFTTNLSGTPNHGDALLIEITGTAARAITWGTGFEASTVALPTTTVTTAMLSVGFLYNSGTSKWRVVGVA